LNQQINPAKETNENIDVFILCVIVRPRDLLRGARFSRSGKNGGADRPARRTQYGRGVP